MTDQSIPELKPNQLGKGVRGQYIKHFIQRSNVVVLLPEIPNAFPKSKAVNKALAMHVGFCAGDAGINGPLEPNAAQAR